MIIRFLTVIALMLTLTACGTTKDQQGDVGEQVAIQNYDPISDPLNGTVPYGSVEGVVPGTQQDLVVNVGDRVFFGYDRFDLTPEAQSVLSMQAEWMQKYPNVNITIEGHADERGTREYNLALGAKRAQAARDYLITLGIAKGRISTKSYGEELPVCKEQNEGCWQKNRHDRFVVIPARST